MMECGNNSTPKATVLYISDKGDTSAMHEAEACAARLSMPFESVANAGALNTVDAGRIAVVLCALSSPSLPQVSKWAEASSTSLHVHVSDQELREVLASPSPVHFAMPSGVRSMSIANGFFRGGYQLYRDAELRDLHFDLPLEWQSQYLSPNEGGSGNTTPLYIDFCFILLGWNALRPAAEQH